MLYREIIAVCSRIHRKRINTLCRQNVELLNVKPRGTYSDHWALMFQKTNEMDTLLSSTSIFRKFLVGLRVPRSLYRLCNKIILSVTQGLIVRCSEI
jgi:hypothetical protein